MSAGAVAAAREPRPDRDIAKLAPKFRAAVDVAISECRLAGYDVILYEAYRSNETAKAYYARGRTVKPPPRPVTNAPDNTRTWHGYGLAVDVISSSKLWSAGDTWYRKVAEIFKKHGCKWGGDWRSPDMPHMQWGHCKASPSELARELLATGGVEAVWKAVHGI